MRFYDTASRRVREFRPIRKGEARIYSCGPSTYSGAHIGNFRTYVFEDVVKRVLLSEGFRVRHVTNITDVEDKSVRAGEGSMARMLALTRKNEAAFRDTCRKLNIIPASRYPRASENVAHMVGMIKKLIRKRLAYRDAGGNIFLDVSRIPGYGRFSRSRFTHGLGRKVMKDDYYQREAGDFLLWKAWKKGDGDVCWRTPLGKGRPGWHIECSAMSARFLGVPFDIHEGGVDNIFSHHENEIAQTRGATGRNPANYWLHVRHLLFMGRKMSKSLGNQYTVAEVHAMGHGYGAIRAHLLGTHYRKRLNFTFAGLRRAERDLSSCLGCMSELRGWKPAKENPDADALAKKTLSSFRAHASDDFDIPAAIGDLCDYVCAVRKLMRGKKFGKANARTALRTIRSMNGVLGFISLPLRA